MLSGIQVSTSIWNHVFEFLYLVRMNFSERKNLPGYKSLGLHIILIKSWLPSKVNREKVF